MLWRDISDRGACRGRTLTINALFPCESGQMHDTINGNDEGTSINLAKNATMYAGDNHNHGLNPSTGNPNEIHSDEKERHVSKMVGGMLLHHGMVLESFRDSRECCIRQVMTSPLSHRWYRYITTACSFSCDFHKWQ